MWSNIPFNKTIDNGVETCSLPDYVCKWYFQVMHETPFNERLKGKLFGGHPRNRLMISGRHQIPRDQVRFALQCYDPFKSHFECDLESLV